VIGAAIVVYLPELLRNQREYADIIYSALVLLIVLVFPTGVAGFRRVLAGLVHRARSS
jgi:ABC-type branched-subunit amino acid transport system permease subunit